MIEILDLSTMFMNVQYPMKQIQPICFRGGVRSSHLDVQFNDTTTLFAINGQNACSIRVVNDHT